MSEMEERRMTLRSAISKEDREERKVSKWLWLCFGGKLMIVFCSQRKLEKEKQDFLNRPTIGYKGRIKYFTTLIDSAFACDQLL